MPLPGRPDLSLRAYGQRSRPHSHDHVQIVLPVSGAMEIEVDGRGQRLGPAVGAVVAPGASHDQWAGGQNRFLVIDLPHADAAGAALAERFGRTPWIPVSAPVRKLIEFAAAALDSGASPDLARLWTPLFLDSLGHMQTAPSRLAALQARLQADPGRGWTVSEMAGAAALSASRLHALFRQELGLTPRDYLAELRLVSAMEQLAGSLAPIAQIAQACGYADQSAFTRALRRRTGQTPAAYRRWRRQQSLHRQGES